MKTRIFKLWLCAMMLCMVNVGFADEHEYVGTPKAAYKSLDDYISESTVKVHSLDSTEIIPHINGITKVYVDLTKGTTNGAYCFLCIKNSSVSKKSVTFSSKYLKTSSDNLRIVDDNNKETIHNITKAADDSTIPFVYYNPQNSDEIIIDIYEYYGCFGFIEKWQSNFGTSCIVNIETADNKPSIKTMIYDATSQPMLVGGYIENYSPLNVVKKGIIVSKNADDMVITEETKFDKADVYLYIEGYVTDKPQDIRFIDCTETNDEEFVCALQFLMGSTDYYVKAFYIDAENEVHYGNAEKVHTQAYNRYDGFAGYGNVWYAFSYTLFDLVTDEIINPNEGFYYTTNENPTTVRYQTGTSYNTCYKLATEWNYKLWYYHSGHSDTSKHLHTPVMSYKNGKLVIEKNPLDADKNITIYYSINGNYFRPENYKDVYTQPLALDEECTVCCYAISSDGYISYTNMYAVMSDQVNDIDKIEDISVKGTSSLTQSHAIYNISGQRLSQPQKGINIIGGKKIVIK